MILQPREKLLFIGDSVTDCERSRPIGEGLFGATGKGYVTQVDGLLSAAYPGHGIRVVNVGTSGNQARHLAERWQTDVLDQRPDRVAMMIGINDVWRQFDLPRQTEQHFLPDAYRTTLDELIRRTLPTVKGMILMTPYFIEINKADAMRVRMDEYGGIVRELAKRHGCLLVDTQAAFDRVLAHQYSAAISWDRIHPNHIGHAILARAFLEGVGFDWAGR